MKTFVQNCKKNSNKGGMDMKLVMTFDGHKKGSKKTAQRKADAKMRKHCQNTMGYLTMFND